MRTRLARIRDAFKREPAPRILDVLGIAICLSVLGVIVEPMFAPTDTWGGHDWDAAQLFRWLVVVSVKKFHQFPFWNPWTCGGHDAWAYSESDATVVNPFAPLFFLVDLRLGIRLEVVGSALLGIAGTWLLAGRVTRSAAGRAFTCLIFMANGRWAQQAANGHVWHLYFAYVPWAWYFFTRAAGVGRDASSNESWWKNALCVGFVLALMVYAGALYPFPHTGLSLAVFGSIVAFQRRTLRPLWEGALAAAVGFGLAAPKLLPMLELFSRAPRIVESPEWIDLGTLLKTLTATTPQPSGNWGWHEYDSFIGWSAVVVLVVALALVRGANATPWKLIGILFLLLCMGSFHEHAPWTWLHKAPIFSSQHVPSRFEQCGLLALGLVVCAGTETLLRKYARGRIFVDAVLLAGVVLVSTEIASQNRKCMIGAFYMHLPAISVRPTFQQETVTPASLYYLERAWSTPALPAAMSNVGVVECTAVGSVGVFNPRGPDGEIAGRGAKGVSDPHYKGEVFVLSGVGTAEIVLFTPNVIEVALNGTQPGDVLVLNQNFDAGWTADGEPTFNVRDRVAANIHSGTRVRFRYRPRRLWAGVAIGVLTLAAIGFALRRARRRTAVADTQVTA